MDFLSLLAQPIEELDPVDHAKQRVESIALVVWFVHQWQLGEEDVDIRTRIRQETDLTRSQLKIIGRIKKQDPEHVILRHVVEAIDSVPSNKE